MIVFRPSVSLFAFAGLILACTSPAAGDSVVPVPAGLRLAPRTVVRIDPQGREPGMPAGADTAILPGDILTLVFPITAIPNGATHALGGYITCYVPGNAEVVSARFVDAAGKTVPARRCGLAQDGTGPRGARDYPAPLSNGSIAQLHADTGIFFSTDSRTSRTPDGGSPGTEFLTVHNGVALAKPTTGAGQFAQLFGALLAPAYAHNTWDALQAHAFGAGAELRVHDGAEIRTFAHPGNGNTPHGYGSPVAGPDTSYAFEVSSSENGVFETAGVVGPWRRILTSGSEMGHGAPVIGSGPLARVGVPTAQGWNLSAENPLPARDFGNPASPWANAVRFAVGELIAGEERFAELSLRVRELPLDPVSGLDVACFEAFGGDAAAFNATAGGKDNPWRYFLPAPACAFLGLQLDLDSDKSIAYLGDQITYSIRVKNLSRQPHTDAVVTCCLAPGLSFVTATRDGLFGQAPNFCAGDAGPQVVTWSPRTFTPGAEDVLTLTCAVVNAATPIDCRAVFSSTELPAPGILATRIIAAGQLAVLDLELEAASDAVSPGASLRYQATVRNVGTGAVSFGGCGSPACGLDILLPPGFTYSPGSARANGQASGEPALAAGVYHFAGPFPDVLAGTDMILELDVDVALNAVPGLQDAAVTVWARDVGAGRQFETSLRGAAGVAVGAVRSEVPRITAPLLEGDNAVRGTTSESVGTAIEVFVNGNLAGAGVAAANGEWTLTVPALVEGQHVTAVAQVTGKVRSRVSLPTVVELRTAPLSRFHRGDPNSSGTIDISDGISVFGFLFLGSEAPGCRESADANNDGAIDISDGIAILGFLFAGGPPPAEPGPPGTPCGSDPDAPGSAGDLGCTAHGPCG